MREKQTQAIQEAPEKARGKLGKIAGWALILGVFLVFHTVILVQKDLERPLAPLHLALVGLLGAFLFGALESKASRLSLTGIALGSGLLSLGFRSSSIGVVVMAAGWPVLIFWSARAALRGGL